MNKFIVFLTMVVFLLVPSVHATIVWTQKADMPTGRDGLGIGVVDGIVYCIGGWTAGTPSSATGAVEAYDPVSNSWFTKVSMPTPRGFLSVCVLNDTIYALGGWNNSSTGLTTVEAYDPISNIWTTKTSMQNGRNGLGGEVVGGKIYAIGGYLSETNIVEEYDPVSNTWVYKTPMPTTRFFFASEVINDKIYVASGRYSGGNLSPTYEYDPSGDTVGGTPWQIKADIPATGYHPEAGVVDGKMYVCGGFAGLDDAGIACGVFGNGARMEYALVQVYNPVSDTWMLEDPMQYARRELDVGVVGNKLYAIGGWPSNVCFINEEGEVQVGIKEKDAIESIADYNYGSTVISGSLPLPRGKACMIYDISGKRVEPHSLKPGIYFIEIDGKIAGKVVKVR